MTLDLFTQTKFDIYMVQNPGLYPMFEKFAFELINAGHKRLGAKMIFERMRWQTMITTKGEYKLNNNYTAELARFFMERNPRYEGIFETRIMTKQDTGFIN